MRREAAATSPGGAETSAPAGTSSSARLKGLVFLALAGLVAYGALSMTWRGEDTHFVQAKRILRDYELGKDPEMLNYEDPAYPSALAELALVDAGSSSAEPARVLAIDINAKVQSFRERVKSEAIQRVRDKEAEEARNAAVLRAQMTTTGIDAGAAERTTARSKTECLEDLKIHQVKKH